MDQHQTPDVVMLDGDDPLMRAVADLCYECLHRPFGVTRDDGWNETDPASTHLAALRDGTLIGYARLVVSDATGHLRQVVVRPGYRGAGVATALVRAAVGRARDAGLGSVVLCARPAAVGVYRACGFRVVGDVFRMGRTYLPHVRMELRLRG